MIAVIGGGAAGMAAAIAAAEQGAPVIVLEQGERVGKKLLSTGNGRCNFTNEQAGEPEYYLTEDPKILKNVLESCPPERICCFLERMGVPALMEEGRLYPRSQQAAAVLDSLRMAMAERGVRERCGARVEAILPRENGFLIRMAAKPGEKEQALWADRVIVAAGGKAAPRLGGGDGGYRLLGELGHSCTALTPALCQLRTETEPIRALKGIRVQAVLKAFCGRKLLKEDTGEVLFTEYGLSGIPALQLSLPVGREKGAVKIALDFFPEWDEAALGQQLRRRAEAFPTRTLSEFFIGMLPKRVGEALWKRAGVRPLEKKAEEISEEELQTVGALAKSFFLRCEGVQCFGSAQVTAGGVLLREFDPASMASRKIPGLFAAGEVLDVAGECGGFNLHWAFSSGLLAGSGAAQW